MRYIIILILLSSCSASNLLSRAIKKDPSIIQERVVIVEKEIPGVFTDTTAMDTIAIDNERIKLLATAKGKIDLSYYIKPVQIIDTTSTKEVNIPEKSSVAKVKARQEGKTHRTKIKHEEKTKQVVQKSNNKGHKCRKPFIPWYVWMLIGLIIGELLRIKWKRLIP